MFGCASGPQLGLGPVDLAPVDNAVPASMRDFLVPDWTGTELSSDAVDCANFDLTDHTNTRFAVVEISTTAIRVGGDHVLDLDATGVPAQQKRGQLISRLYDRLLEVAETSKEVGRRLGCDEAEFRGNILLAVDRSLPFSLVREVMYTAGQAQFGNFHFLVDDPLPTPMPADHRKTSAPTLFGSADLPSLVITRTGLTLTGASAAMLPCGGGCQTVGDYDWAGLSTRLEEAHQRDDRSDIVVVPSGDVPHGVLMEAFDRVTRDRIGGPLYPFVIVAGGAACSLPDRPRGRVLGVDSVVPVFRSTLPAIGAPASPGGAGKAARREGLRSKVVQQSGVLGLIGARGVESDAPPPPPPSAPAPAPKASQAPTRTWFPESFLWRPLVETDADGIATVDVTVPDSLTSWRVLALAHSEDGQAGAVHTFDSVKPVHVDVVAPGWLHAGDRIALPLQVMNQSPEPVTSPLVVQATGLAAAARLPMAVPAGASRVTQVVLTPDTPGHADIAVDMAPHDAVRKQIPVRPVGQEVRVTAAGTLSASTSLELKGPQDASWREVTLTAWPGPLAIVQEELERTATGAVSANPAYGYAAARHAAELAEAVGVDVDVQGLKRSRRLAWQRLVRAARSPDGGQATDLLLALDVDDPDPLAADLARRLQTTVLTAQRADGSWSRTERAPLSQVIQWTALSARVVPDAGARLRAQGALERYSRDITDPYTAAVVLASGVAEASTEERARAVLTEAVLLDEERVRVPQVAGIWGPIRPAELLAFAVLALEDSELRGQLTAALMRWHSRDGFGAGSADPLCLEALRAALPPVPEPVTVTLSVDGRSENASLDPTQPRRPVRLRIPTTAASPQVVAAVEPAVPGLVYRAEHRAWTPYDGELDGVEVEVEAAPMRIGQSSALTLRLSAPSGVSLTVEQGLAPGAGVSFAHTDTQLASWQCRSDRVELRTAPFGAGEVLEIPLLVQPVFAGRFSTPPLTIVASNGERAALQPVRWDVADGPILGGGAAACRLNETGLPKLKPSPTAGLLESLFGDLPPGDGG